MGSIPTQVLRFSQGLNTSATVYEQMGDIYLCKGSSHELFFLMLLISRNVEIINFKY